MHPEHPADLAGLKPPVLHATPCGQYEEPLGRLVAWPLYPSLAVVVVAIGFVKESSEACLDQV